MKRIVIDSVFWIALKLQKDKWFKSATKLRQKVLQAEEIYISEPIIVETVNYLLRKLNAEVAQEVLHDFLNSSKIKIITNNEITRVNALELLRQYPRLSYTDATIVWMMNQHKIQNLISFDNRFDGITDINRITT